MNFTYHTINIKNFNKNTLDDIIKDNITNNHTSVLTFLPGLYKVCGNQDIIDNGLILPMPTGSIIFSQNTVIYIFTSQSNYIYSKIIDLVLPIFFNEMFLITKQKWEFKSNDIVVNNKKIGSLAKWKYNNYYCTGVFFSGTDENLQIVKFCTKERTKQSTGLAQLKLTDQQIISIFNNICKTIQLS